MPPNVPCEDTVTIPPPRDRPERSRPTQPRPTGPRDRGKVTLKKTLTRKAAGVAVARIRRSQQVNYQKAKNDGPSSRRGVPSNGPVKNGQQSGYGLRSETRSSPRPKSASGRSAAFGKPTTINASESSLPTNQPRVVVNVAASTARTLRSEKVSQDEFKILTEFRNTLPHHGTKPPPSETDIANVFTQIDAHVGKAVQNYVRSKSCVGLTFSKLSHDSVTLCQTFLPSYQAEDVRYWLELFLDHERASTEQALKVIAMAAIFGFVFHDDEGTFVRRDADQANSAGLRFFSRCKCPQH